MMRLEHLTALAPMKWWQSIPISASFIFFIFQIRLSLHPFLEDKFPLAFFIIGSMVIAIFFGIRIGLSMLTASLAIAYYYFIPPYYSFSIATTSQFFYLILNYILGIALILLISWIKNDGNSFADQH